MKKVLISFLVVMVISIRANAFTLPTAQGSKYIQRILFTLKYGPGDDQISVGAPKLGEPSSGPGGINTFTLDREGNIYIGTGRGQIKKFSQEGKLLLIIEGGISNLSSVAIDPEGNIYVIHGTGCNRLIKFDKTGKEVYRTPKYYTRENYEVLKKIEDDMWQEMNRVPGFEENQYDKEGRRYEFNQLEGFKTQVNVYEKDKKEAVKSFTIPPAGAKGLSEYGAPLKQSFNDIGGSFSYWLVDSEGNLYRSGYAKRKEPIELRKGYDFTIYSDVIVCKYNPEGKFITQLRFPSQPISGLNCYDEIKVDEQGNIYTLRFHVDRMNVIKYEWVEEGSEVTPASTRMKGGTQTPTEEKPEVLKIKRGEKGE